MSTTDKNNQDWKNKFSDIMQTCQNELKKTTKIGMKMLSASQANTQLHESYEEVGRWLIQNIDSKEIEISDQKILDLHAKIKELESELELFEKDVQDIKNQDHQNE